MLAVGHRVGWMFLRLLTIQSSVTVRRRLAGATAAAAAAATDPCPTLSSNGYFISSESIFQRIFPIGHKTGIRQTKRKKEGGTSMHYTHVLGGRKSKKRQPRRSLSLLVPGVRIFVNAHQAATPPPPTKTWGLMVAKQRGTSAVCPSTSSTPPS